MMTIEDMQSHIAKLEFDYRKLVEVARDWRSRAETAETYVADLKKELERLNQLIETLRHDLKASA